MISDEIPRWLIDALARRSTANADTSSDHSRDLKVSDISPEAARTLIELISGAATLCDKDSKTRTGEVDINLLNEEEDEILRFRQPSHKLSSFPGSRNNKRITTKSTGITDVKKTINSSSSKLSSTGGTLEPRQGLFGSVLRVFSGRRTASEAELMEKNDSREDEGPKRKRIRLTKYDMDVKDTEKYFLDPPSEVLKTVNLIKILLKATER